MNKILLIEDNEDHYNAIKGIYSEKGEVYPETILEFNNLSSEISNYFMDNYNKGESNQFILEFLNRIENISTIVIDYELCEKKGDSVNGLKFYNVLIRNFTTKIL